MNYLRYSSLLRPLFDRWKQSFLYELQGQSSAVPFSFSKIPKLPAYVLLSFLFVCSFVRISSTGFNLLNLKSYLVN